MKKGTRRIMSVAERENLTAQIERKEAFRDALQNDAPAGQTAPIGDLGSGKAIDTNALEASIAHQKRILAEGMPEQVTGPKRLALEKQAKEDAEYLSEHLLTRRELDLFPRHGHDYSRAVQKSLKHEVGSAETQKRMQRYRETMARLDPDNPEAQSVEALRRDS